ncbi:MAG TPA: sigma 54-interacting transcriptional regulator [Steroidobacteraceae bacterium]|nr:sigma 54-interacting transcriptional regulator [Steroidobacteraceae bacterium]
MTNATGSRHYDDAVREAAGVAHGSSVGALAAGHSEALVASVAAELDRLSEQIFGSGCTLSLTDPSGAVLYERSDGLPARAQRPPAAAGAIDAGPIFVSFPAGNLHRPLSLENLAGEDPQMLRNVRSAYRIADSNVSVLIQGPTGSGKEAFAHAMHIVSRRADRPFVAVNCAAIPETLIESELFGYRPGAFTGARKEGMRGKILQSSGGTLFLDEIGDMPLALQTRLLRVLEQQEIVPLGSETAINVDLHVIAASHRNLRDMIVRGAFREDLYYRLNGITLELPALKDRADKERVIHRALAAETGNGRPAAIEMDALTCLLEYPWPGNIRELHNVIRTALAICDGGVVRSIDLPREIRESPAPGCADSLCSLSPAETSANSNPLQVAERAALARVVEECRGNMTRAAAQLGISRNTLYRKFKRHGIALPRGR